ncbi:MAG: right-handed parallel beta-helix repeat-containing protein [Candidatus Bathyarchaeia archaeon]|jgi:hypothetical protein
MLFNSGGNFSADGVGVDLTVLEGTGVTIGKGATGITYTPGTLANCTVYDEQNGYVINYQLGMPFYVGGQRDFSYLIMPSTLQNGTVAYVAINGSTGQPVMELTSINFTSTANSAIANGNVYIAPGLYQENGSLTIATSNRTLTLADGAILKVGNNQNAAAISIDGLAAGHFLNDITISGGEIDGNNNTQHSIDVLTNSGGIGVFAVYGNRILVEKMYIHDVQTHYIFFGGCNNSTARDNTCIYAYLGHGIEADKWNDVSWYDGYSRNILFENNYCENSGWSQMKMENINGGRIVGNTLVGGIYDRGNAFGLELSNPGPELYSWNVVVSENTLRNCTSAFAITEWGGNLQILDNTMENCYRGIEALRCNGLSIFRNSAINMTVSNGISIDTCNNTKIGGNTIINQTNTPSAGLLVIHSNNTEISGGSSENCAAGLTILYSNNGTLTGYSTSKSLYSGCRLYGSAWTVTSNSFYSNGRVGLDLRGQNNTVTGNSMISNGWQGINIENDTAVTAIYNIILANRIDYSGANGILEASGN